MDLPRRKDGSGAEIGISDILAWRDCPARAKMGRLRLEGKEAPESQSPAAAYGSAVHLCIAMLDDGHTQEECADAAMAQYTQWLEPNDLSRLYDDIEKYLAREILGVRTLLNEGEISVPLFVHPTAGQVWFRCQIDRLLQSIDDPKQLVHLDWKSGKWPKSDEEVNADPQLWAYNWGMHEWFTRLYPEVGPPNIQQWYDQLRYGQIPTRKSDGQRAEIKRWLIAVVTAMIADEDEAPTFNQWCPWCSLKFDCPVVQFQLTDWATTRIAALMPREEKLKKDGTPSKRAGPVKLDPERIAEYVKLVPDVKRAKQVLEMFEKEINATLKQMPSSDLHGHGKKLVERSTREFSPTAKREIIETLGLGTFLILCDLSLASVERFFGDDKEAAAPIVALAEKRPGYDIVVDA